MPIKQSTIQNFALTFTKFNVSSTNSSVVLECRDCKEKQYHTVQKLNRRMCKGFKTECASYQCEQIKVSGNFRNLGCRNIECNDCGLVYHIEKKVRYFECYCNLRNKQTEHMLYKELINGGFHKLSRESYWNRDLTNHKCDILIHHVSGKYIYIEVDDFASHNASVSKTRDDTFNKLFNENRLDNEYLIRVVAEYLDDPDYIEEIIQKVNDPNLEAFVTL